MCTGFIDVSIKILFTIFYIFISNINYFWIIKAIFRSRKRTHQSKEDQAYYEQHSSYQNQQTTYQNHQSSDPDIIDVDYKVVDEEDNTQ